MKKLVLVACALACTPIAHADNSPGPVGRYQIVVGPYKNENGVALRIDTTTGRLESEFAEVEKLAGGHELPLEILQASITWLTGNKP